MKARTTEVELLRIQTLTLHSNMKKVAAAAQQLSEAGWWKEKAADQRKDATNQLSKASC